MPSFISDYSSSIIAFYIAVVYVISKEFRSGFVPQSNNIFIQNTVNTSELLMICQCIYIYRLQRNLDK